jgi:hypothetical protein
MLFERKENPFLYKRKSKQNVSKENEKPKLIFSLYISKVFCTFVALTNSNNFLHIS